MSNVTSSAYPVVTFTKAGDQFVIVQGGQLKKVTRQGLANFITSLAPNTLISLSDVPGSYVGQQGKLVQVNNGATGLQFTDKTDIQTSGWAQYADTVYTSGSPFSILANTDTILPNNAGAVIDSQLPDDVAEFYDGTVITGRNGDDIIITVDFQSVPTAAGTTNLEFWFDIGGSIGQLYRRIITFPKGVGVIRPVNFTVMGYTLDTWETNGATVYVRANGTADLYDIRYIISRNHKAV